MVHLLQSFGTCTTVSHWKVTLSMYILTMTWNHKYKWLKWPSSEGCPGLGSSKGCLGWLPLKGVQVWLPLKGVWVGFLWRVSGFLFGDKGEEFGHLGRAPSAVAAPLHWKDPHECLKKLFNTSPTKSWGEHPWGTFWCISSALVWPLRTWVRWHHRWGWTSSQRSHETWWCGGGQVCGVLKLEIRIKHTPTIRVDSKAWWSGYGDTLNSQSSLVNSCPESIHI